MDYQQQQRRHALALRLENSREAYVEAQAQLDAFDMDVGDPPPKNICRNCKFYSDVRCVRTKTPEGFDPVYGHRTFNWGELPLAISERQSVLPWRCGPKGRHFKRLGYT